MNLMPYPTYESSGVRWVTAYPSHWAQRRFKTIFRERTGRSLAGEELLLSVSAYTGVRPRHEVVDDGDHLSRAESLEGYKLCFRNDLVVNIMLAWNRGLGVTTFDGMVSPAYCVFSIIDGSDPTFLNYLVRSDPYIHYFKAFSSGVIDSRLRIYPDTFGQLCCALPPLAEQQLIVAFLDRETAKIDTLIAEQRTLINRLGEKRVAIISHAVTKGLEPETAMKPSGLSWFGEIPEKWEVRRVKSLCSFTTSGPRGWSERICDNGELFIQSGDLNDLLKVEFSTAKRVKVEADAEAARTQLQDGDVLVCITGAKTGKVAVCMSVPETAYVNQHLCLIRPNSEIMPTYLGFFLGCQVGQTYFEFSQYGLKQGLSLDDVREAPVFLPSPAEQFRIIEFIESETNKIDTLVGEAERSISLLQEHRSALITAVVTGKVDVRDAVKEKA